MIEVDIGVAARDDAVSECQVVKAQQCEQNERKKRQDTTHEASRDG
jgi:hypothetical protein